MGRGCRYQCDKVEDEIGVRTSDGDEDEGGSDVGPEMRQVPER